MPPLNAAIVPPGPPAAPATRPLGVLGAAVALFGAVLVVVAFTALDWLEPTSLVIDFPQLRHAVDASGSTALAAAYFGWLAWLLLAAAAVLALAANIPSRWSALGRAVGTVVGAGAALVTVLALQVRSSESLHTYVAAAGVGYWFAIVGFAALAVGAALGVSRPRPLP